VLIEESFRSFIYKIINGVNFCCRLYDEWD